MNKVSSSLLSFGRKLIAPAMSVSSSAVSPINTEIHSSSSSSSSSSPPLVPPSLPHPLAEPSPAPAPPLAQSHAQSQHYRLLKSESMPVHLSKGEQPSTRRSRLVPAQVYACCCHVCCVCRCNTCEDRPPPEVCPTASTLVCRMQFHWESLRSVLQPGLTHMLTATMATAGVTCPALAPSCMSV